MEITLTAIEVVALLAGGITARLLLLSGLDFAIRRAAALSGLLSAVVIASLPFAPLLGRATAWGILALWFVTFCVPVASRSTTEAHVRQSAASAVHSQPAPQHATHYPHAA